MSAPVSAHITEAVVYLPDGKQLTFGEKQIAGVMPGVLIVHGEEPGSSVHYHMPFSAKLGTLPRSSIIVPSLVPPRLT